MGSWLAGVGVVLNIRLGFGVTVEVMSPPVTVIVAGGSVGGFVAVASSTGSIVSVALTCVEVGVLIKSVVDISWPPIKPAMGVSPLVIRRTAITPTIAIQSKPAHPPNATHSQGLRF